jgi:hypothetical protein
MKTEQFPLLCPAANHLPFNLKIPLNFISGEVVRLNKNLLIRRFKNKSDVSEGVKEANFSKVMK